MNTKEFRRRWVRSKIEPELFYMPIKNKNKEFLIELSCFAKETSGHSANAYADSIHGYTKFTRIELYHSLFSTPNIDGEQYTNIHYKQIQHGAYGGFSNFYHILDKNKNIVGEYQTLYNEYQGYTYNFNISINPQKIKLDKFFLSTIGVSGRGRGSSWYQCKNPSEHPDNLRGSYINSNCRVYANINNNGGYFFLKSLYPNIVDEIINQNIKYGTICWWTYINTLDKTVRSRYFIANEQYGGNVYNEECFNLAEHTELILFSYK